MTRVQEIESAIEALSHAEYVKLREWFLERDWEQWDKEIEADANAGKLDFLIAEVHAEMKQGRLREL